MYYYSQPNGGSRGRQGGDFFREIETISKDIAGKLKDYFEGMDPQGAVSHIQRHVRPAIDVTEDAQNVYVRAEIPGVSKSDIDLVMTGGRKLTISGTKSEVTHEGETDVLRSERRFGDFSREIELPDTHEVDPDQITATYTDGILTVTLPKVTNGASVRIDVS